MADSDASVPTAGEPANGPATRAPRRVRPEGLIYGVDDIPPAGRLVLLGLQQVLVIATYLVRVVLVVRAARAPAAVARSAISPGVVALGIGAAAQAVRWGPVGSGYLAPPVFSAVYLHPSLAAASAGGLPLVYGM